MSIESVVDATVQIRFGGEPIGSGFRFIHDDTILTCSHIFPTLQEGVPISARDGTGEEFVLEILDYSPERPADGHDYAILQIRGDPPTPAEGLQPSVEEPNRGDKVVFAGHPFDLPETLSHTATISGPHQRGFYLDGSVNYGNSGGPIVDIESDEVIGIITESRIYQDRSLVELIDDLNKVQQQLLRIAEVHDTEINRVGVEGLAIETVQTIQEGLNILSDNVSSGIGVGYSIRYALAGVEDLDLG